MNGFGCVIFLPFFFEALSEGGGMDDTISFVFGFARSSAEPCQLRGFLGLSTLNEFRSSSVSDKFPMCVSLIRSLVISACARGLGFSLGLLTLAGFPALGFINPFFAALSRTSCAVSTGFYNREWQTRLRSLNGLKYSLIHYKSRATYSQQFKKACHCFSKSH